MKHTSNLRSKARRISLEELSQIVANNFSHRPGYDGAIIIFRRAAWPNVADASHYRAITLAPMQRPLFTTIGAPVEEIDTPSLLVDLDRLDANIAVLEAPARAAVWIHKTPAIAHRQAQSPHCRGLAVRSLAEAEVFAAAGFTDIRVLRPLVTATTRQRAQALARSVRLSTADDAEDAPLWSEEALAGAVTVSARVASAPESGLAIHDCGQKAIGRDFGNPRIKGREQLKAVGGSAEHGIVHGKNDARLPRIGDWLELIPADLTTAFALHDVVYGIRGGRLEATWPVSARGAF